MPTREYAFELALCARREGEVDGVLARQLGASVHGTRVVDVVEVEPGPQFDRRVAVTPATIPHRVLEADVGAGEARYWRDCFDGHPERDRAAVDHAVDVGFLERERRNGRDYVRQVARYPDWFGAIRGVENKPDLGTPGDLELQLRKDVSLALLDEVVLATESYVTRAHLNRIPDEVGVWRFDPDTGEREVVREPTRLPATGPGVEVLAEHPGRTEVRPVTAAEKARARVRLAERAYGKGWRERQFPDCARCVAGERFGAAALPHCRWKDRLVDPATECGPDCPGHEAAPAPTPDVDAARAERSAWDADPTGFAREQSGLDRFG